MAHQEHSQKFLQKKHGKNILFLEGRWGTESLNQKNLPRVVFEIPGPPCTTVCIQKLFYKFSLMHSCWNFGMLYEHAQCTQPPDLRYIPTFIVFWGHFIFIPFYFVDYSIYMRTCTAVTHPFASVTPRDNWKYYFLPFLNHATLTSTVAAFNDTIIMWSSHFLLSSSRLEQCSWESWGRGSDAAGIGDLYPREQSCAP